MKVINLAESRPTLDDVIRLARNGVVVLREADGTAFALAALDDFDVEVELLRNSPDFLSFLRQLSSERASITLDDLRAELAL